MGVMGKVPLESNDSEYVPERPATGGATIVKEAEEIPVRPDDVKSIVAPVTAAALVAVNPEKVAVPSTAATGEVPPRVHAPAPTAAETEAVLVVVFPY